MATINNNPLMTGVSGMVGNVCVYRQLRGKTIMANRPGEPRYESEWQRINRKRFRDAASFARLAMLDPKKKEYFRTKASWMKLPNAYTAAVALYLNKVRSPEPGEFSNVTYYRNKNEPVRRTRIKSNKGTVFLPIHSETGSTCNQLRKYS